jgi:O-antigen ligase
VTVAGIARPEPARHGVARTSVAPPPANAIPFWCLMLFTFVLFLAPQAIFPSLELLRLGKISAGLAVAAYILNLLWSRRPLTVVTPEVHLVAWFTLLAVISIPLSRSPSGSLEFFLGTGEKGFVKSIIIFFLVANLLETVGRLKLLIAFMVLSGFIFSATALRNFAAGYTVPSDPDRIWGYPSPVAGHVDGIALILNVTLWLTVGLYLVTRQRLVKALLAVGMGLMVGGIIVSLSRGALLALAVTSAVFLAKLLRARGARVLVPASALVVLGMLLTPAGYADRLYSLVDWNYDRVGSISQRAQEIQVALTHFLENPFFGQGLGMESFAYVDQGLGYGWSTHNPFLQVGVDLGLPGLLVYALLAVQVLRGLRQTLRRLGPVPQAREVVAVAVGLELAFCSYLVGAFFLPNPYEFTLFYLAGMAVAMRVICARLAGLPSLNR